MDLLVEIARLTLTSCGAIAIVSGFANIKYSIEDLPQVWWYHFKRGMTDVIIAVIPLSILALSSCTPRTNLAHQYHVASVTINGERTETDFLLTTKGEN